jgi:putative ABC transport system permease protein
MLVAVQTLWFERKRYWAGVMAVAFSVVLIAVQIGLVNGLMSMVSFPVDLSRADVWITAPKVQSCDLGSLIDRDSINRLVVHPSVVQSQEYIQGFTFWKHPKVGQSLVIVGGGSLGEDTLGPMCQMPATLRSQLSEFGAVVINTKDKKKLGVEKVGDTATVFGTRVRVVGFVNNMASFTGPYILCSLRTARALLALEPDRTYYLLASCPSPEAANQLVADINSWGKVSAYLASDFSRKSRWYWIESTNAGVAIGFVGLLGLVVGAVITSQTLYGAVLSSLRELMVLRALGVPRWRMSTYVLWQGLLVGVLGVALGIPTSLGVGWIARVIGTKPILDVTVLVFSAVVAIVTATLSGLYALRSLSKVEPVQLLR